MVSGPLTIASRHFFTVSCQSGTVTLGRILCCFGRHQPAPHAVLLVGRALTRCQRCPAALLSDGGAWKPFRSPHRRNLESLLATLDRE